MKTSCEHCVLRENGDDGKQVSCQLQKLHLFKKTSKYVDNHFEFDGTCTTCTNVYSPTYKKLYVEFQENLRNEIVKHTAIDLCVIISLDAKIGSINFLMKRVNEVLSLPNPPTVRIVSTKGHEWNEAIINQLPKGAYLDIPTSDITMLDLRINNIIDVIPNSCIMILRGLPPVGKTKDLIEKINSNYALHQSLPQLMTDFNNKVLFTLKHIYQAVKHNPNPIKHLIEICNTKSQ